MSATDTAITTSTWNADALHSSVGFRVKHLGVSTFRSRFETVEARYDGDSGKLTGSVPVESIAITQEDFRGHVLAADFFDAANHPTVSFEADGVQLGTGNVEVPGRLTIKGITKDVVATGHVGEPGPDPYGGERVELELRTTVDRRQYDMNWQAETPAGKLALANEVTIEVTLELVKEA